MLVLYFPHLEVVSLGQGTNSKATHCLASPSGVRNAPQHEDMCRTFQGASVIRISWDPLTVIQCVVMCHTPACMCVMLRIIICTYTYNIYLFIMIYVSVSIDANVYLDILVLHTCYTMASPRLLEYTVRTEFPWAQMPQAWISWDFFAGASFQLDWQLQGYTVKKLRWNPKMEVWKMIFLFKQVIFRFHVNFPGFHWFESIICDVWP